MSIRKKLRNFYNNQLKENAKLVAVGWKSLKISCKVRPWAVALNIFGGLIETAASILTIYASAKLAALLANFVMTGNSEDIWFWLWIDIAAAATSGFAFWMMRYSERLLYFSMNKWAVDVFLDSVSRIDIADFYDDEIRNRINKANSGYTWQIPNLSYTMLELIYSVIRFIAIAIVVAQIGWWLVVVIAIFLLPTLFNDARLAKISWLVWNEKGDNRHIFAGITWMFSLPPRQMEIRSMQTKQYLLKRVHRINDTFFDEQERKYKRANPLSISAKFFEVGGVAIGSIVLLRQFLGGALSLEKYFFLSGALLRVGGALNAIFNTLSRLQDPLQFAANFYELLETKPKIVDIENARALNTEKAPSIEFVDVGFTYPGQTKPVFQNLSFSIKSGDHIALVGENGAGKTTIIKLLMRFYQPDKGTILINGEDLQTITIDSWYAQIATLFQDFNQYPLPIDENIYLSRPDQKDDMKRLNEAAKFGGVDKLVKKYEHGWETVLDASFKKGIEPSGGQWQRVALARAFYRQAQMLILDEPTSAIDAKAEYDIFNNIFDHYGNKTALIVSHRFSTVRRANRIIVLDKGKIVEQGSHQTLMRHDGLYHDLFTKQAEGYKD